MNENGDIVIQRLEDTINAYERVIKRLKKELAMREPYGSYKDWYVARVRRALEAAMKIEDRLLDDLR